MGAVLKMKERVTVGSLIDAMSTVREARRALSEEDKKLSAEYEALQKSLIEMMDNEGIAKSTGKKASAGISETTQFNITDWDAFTEYMRKKKWFHLVQRRISTPSVREIFEKFGAIPGLEPWTKREINLRNL